LRDNFPWASLCADGYDTNCAKGVNGRCFDLCTAEIDADAESGSHRLCTFIGAKQERGYGLLSSILYNPAA
jgi:hypothetical protein